MSNTTKTIHWANSVHTHWAAGIRKNIHSLTTCLFNYCTTSLASFKSKLVLTFWYGITQVVLEKRPLNRCSSSSNSTFN